jgi:hypothetical protein
VTRILTILAATLLALVIVGGILLITERAASAARATSVCQEALQQRTYLVQRLRADYWDEREPEYVRVRQPIEADIARYCG